VTENAKVRELSEKDVMTVLDMMRKEFNVDERRIYIMGHSMGGSGTLYLASKYPQIWAAAAPIAPPGAGGPGVAESLGMSKLPTFVVQGDADTAVPVAGTRAFIDRLKAQNAVYEYLEIPGATHNITGIPEIYKFFEKHSNQRGSIDSAEILVTANAVFNPRNPRLRISAVTLMKRIRTQVGIVGAGPAGLMLGHLLSRAGIDSVIVEDRPRDYVIERVRAGVLEQGSVDLMIESGVGDRLQREGLFHDGVFFNVFGKRHRIDFAALTGRRITVYGQNEVVKDLIAARLTSGRPLLFEVADVSVHALDSTQPKIRFTSEGVLHEIRCDFIAGCDGFHGVCRPSIESYVRTYDRVYPFGWLGILAHASPSSP
jgi:hypothetical protein